MGLNYLWGKTEMMGMGVRSGLVETEVVYSEGRRTR